MILMASARISTTVMVLLLTVLLVTACSKSGTDTGDKKVEVIQKVLTLQGIEDPLVTVRGNAIEITYEASNADDYDTQVVSDWGTIFGTLAEFDYDPIVIVNTVNGIPYATLTTTRENLHAFMTGAKNETVFWEDVAIETG